MFGDSDLGVFFNDFGVTVQFAGSSALGNFDQPQSLHMADRGFGGFDAVLPRLQLPYNAFNPMPTTTDTLNVNGQNYTVSEITTEADGAILSFALKVAP